MKSIKLKTLLCVAGVLGVSALGVSVQAQGTPLFTGGSATTFAVADTVSTYTFSGSMIVNSIGLYTGGATPAYIGWALNNGQFQDITNQSYTISDGFRWYTLNQSFSGTNTLQVQTTFSTLNNSFLLLPSENSNLNVSLTNIANLSNNIDLDGAINSNIRVSNPGSNVAPEPGTFALALTGGAALAGVGLRRRRKLG
jgi:hypothetical protein